MRKYLPTPKVTVAIVIGLLAFGAMWVADVMAWSSVEPQLQSLFVLALSIIAAWLKRDDSSPEDDAHGVPQ